MRFFTGVGQVQSLGDRRNVWLCYDSVRSAVDRTLSALYQRSDGHHTIRILWRQTKKTLWHNQFRRAITNQRLNAHFKHMCQCHSSIRNLALLQRNADVDEHRNRTRNNSWLSTSHNLHLFRTFFFVKF